MRSGRGLFLAFIRLISVLSACTGLLIADAPSPVSASFDAPLIMLMKGDLWAWTKADGLQQFTHSGYVYRPIISPDGTHMAYKSVAEIDVPHLHGGPECGPSDSALTDIWALDLKTRQVRQIAKQPDKLQYDTSQSDPEHGLLRSDPAWSPDSNKLAWIEGDPTDRTAQLIIYDLPTSSQVLKIPITPEIRPEGICWVLPSPDWADGGLALNINNQVVVYDDHGKEILRDYEYQTILGEFDVGWVSENGKSYLGIRGDYRYCWHLLDPTTKQDIEIGKATMEIYSLMAGRNAKYTVSFQQQDDDNNPWKIVDRSGTEEPLEITWAMWEGRIAIDPTGRAVAYTANDGVYVRQSDGLTKIAGTDDIVVEDFSGFGGMLTWNTLGLRVRKRGDSPCAAGG